MCNNGQILSLMLLYNAEKTLSNLSYSILSIFMTESHIFHILQKYPFQSHTTSMANFYFRRHPVTILVTVLTNPHNLNNKDH